ncbi:MAG: NAD(+)/NADH kinase [Clostridia bacterium]|nr:NAD(+)/NADH kinase [Clostridia bacterium]
MIGFFFRESNARSVAASKKLKKLLSGSGLVHRDLEEDECTVENCADIDLLIVFGGDGSVLRAAKIALSRIPIVAINTGNVGFLTSYEESDLETLVSDIKNDNLKFSKRKLMKVTCGDKTYYALNDVTVTKNYHIDDASECVKLHLKIDGEFVDTYVADGMVIATPTGSTAYALSAGGPIITPRVSAFVATPICAHSLHSRPIVFSEKAKTSVTVDKRTKECVLYIDGAATAPVPCGGTVFVERSDIAVNICEFAQNFFNKLSTKLNIWSTTDVTKETE